MRYSDSSFFQIFISLFILTVLVGCKTDADLPQGLIVYDVSYPTLEQSILENVLPSEMTILYKGDKVRGELRSVGGIVNSEFIGNQKTKELQQLLKSYQEYFVCKLNAEGVENFIQSFPNVRLEPTDEIINVAGYDCQVTLAYPTSGDENPMRIYHTDALGLSNPNWYTQFNQIDGVLLGYELEQFGMTMRLEAKEVVQRPVEDAVFVVDAKYVDINSAEMEEKFEKLMSDFND